MDTAGRPRRSDGVDVRRAQRWFWALTLVAVLAMGALYQALRADPSPGTGLLVAASSLVLALSCIQAARILTRLAGPPRLPHPVRALAARRRTAPSPGPSARRPRP